MGRLSVEHAVAVDLKLPDEGAGVLAEVVEDLHDLAILENLFERLRELGQSHEIKYEAVTADSHLKPCYFQMPTNLAAYLDQREVFSSRNTFAVHSNDQLLAIEWRFSSLSDVGRTLLGRFRP